MEKYKGLEDILDKDSIKYNEPMKKAYYNESWRSM